MRVCVPRRRRAIGGPTTFLGHLALGLQRRGVEFTTDLGQPCDVIMVLARPPLPHISLPQIIWHKRRGVKVVHRLDAIYYPACWAGASLRDRFMMRITNLVAGYIHGQVADLIVYQSEFSRSLVNRFLPHSSSPWRIIHNGTDLTLFSPTGPANDLPGDPVLTTVHAFFRRAYELSPILDAHRIIKGVYPQARLVVVGEMSARLERLVAENPDVSLAGSQPAAGVASHMRSARVALFAKLNSACPNVLIESMASGLPTACYDTGANGELLGESGGVCAPWQGNDYARFDPGDPQALAGAALALLAEPEKWSRLARERAESLFSLERMTDRYVQAFQAALDA